MKPQYRIPMLWPRGQMFIEAIDWTKFHKHCRKHGIDLTLVLNDNKRGK